MPQKNLCQTAVLEHEWKTLKRNTTGIVLGEIDKQKQEVLKIKHEKEGRRKARILFYMSSTRCGIIRICTWSFICPYPHKRLKQQYWQIIIAESMWLLL